MTDNRLESLRKKRDQLNARIQKEAAREKKKERKERDARLMVWGVVVDEMLQSGQLSADKWASTCRQYLTREHDLRRALTGPLAGQAAPDPQE